jgi:hypothetical protein
MLLLSPHVTSVSAFSLGVLAAQGPSCQTLSHCARNEVRCYSKTFAKRGMRSSYSGCGNVAKDTERWLAAEMALKWCFLATHGGISQLDVCFKWMMLWAGNKMTGREQSTLSLDLTLGFSGVIGQSRFWGELHLVQAVVMELSQTMQTNPILLAFHFPMWTQNVSTSEENISVCFIILSTKL